jgi:hypothetical protein
VGYLAQRPGDLVNVSPRKAPHRRNAFGVKAFIVIMLAFLAIGHVVILFNVLNVLENLL